MINQNTTQDKSPKPQLALKAEDQLARRVVVPVANPKTTPQLIRFAASLVHPERGKVKAVYINLPDSPYGDTRQEISQIIKQANGQNLPVEMVVINAVSVARGVLDAVLETNADLLVLGFQQPTNTEVVFGPITEAVAQVVPTDLIVYRHVPDQIHRVVVPFNDLERTKIALHHAAQLAHYHQVDLVVMYVETTGTPTPFWREDRPLPVWQQMALLEMSIYDEPYAQDIQHKIVTGMDFVGGVVNATDSHDLIVLTVQRNTNPLQKWLFGVTAQKMLRLAPGSIALVKQPNLIQGSAIERLRYWVQRWTPTLTLSERTNVIDQAGDLARFNTNFSTMITLASVLASIGLLQSSAAVIIGAMLVAPLMSPLMGFGVGLAMGELPLMRRSVQTVIFGVVLVLGVSTFLGAITAFSLPTNEMLARGEPTFLDMLVALASGVAGAFALARRDIPAALAGVAIAAALVPPICTIGLALAIGEFDLAFGAALLSLVNIICISLAAAGTFALLGIHATIGVSTMRRLILSVIVLVGLALPMGFFLYQSSQRNQLEYQSRKVIEAQFEDARVISVEINYPDVFVTLRSPHDINLAEISVVQDEIEDRTGQEIILHLVVLQTLQVKSIQN